MTVIIDGYEVLINENDMHFLSKFKWHIQVKSNTNYVVFNTTLKGRKYKMFRLHRTIMGLENVDWKKFVVDHINGNGLDNRRCNLRIVTLFENSMNRKKSKNNTTGYTGVDFSKSEKKFRARISKYGKRHELGLFNTAEEAYQAYLMAKTKFHR
jgi:hypothetical protein